MLRKLLFLTGLLVLQFLTSAFRFQDSGGVMLPTGWIAFLVTFVIIVIIAILLILQARKTPEVAARYHLDHAEHTHVEEATPDAENEVEPVPTSPELEQAEKLEPAQPPLETLHGGRQNS
jgi:hypothetical protein